jgi:transcriptional regulator with XRE-family HTH domain
MRHKQRLRLGLMSPDDVAVRPGLGKGRWRFDDAMAERILRKLGEGLPVSHFAGSGGFPPASAISMRYKFDRAFAKRADQVAPGRFRPFKWAKPRPSKFGDEVWEAVAKLLNEGWTVTAIGDLPGMPKSSSISQRRRKDANFAALVPPPKYARTGQMPKQVWDQVLAHMRAGITIKDIGVLPGMPTRAVISRRISSDPAFGSLALQARRASVQTPDERRQKVIERQRKGKEARRLARSRKLSPNAKFFTPQNIKAVREKRKWSQLDLAQALGASQTQVCLWEKGKAAKPETMSRVGAVLAEILALKPSGTQHRPTRIQPSPYIQFFTAENLKLLRERNGWTQGQLAAALDTDQPRISSYELGRSARTATANKIGERAAKLLGIQVKPVAKSGRRHSAAEGAQIYAEASAAVPKRLGADAHAEIVGNIVMAVYDGTLSVGDIGKKAPEYIQAYRQEYEGLYQSSLEDSAGADGFTLANKLGLY